MYTELPHWNQDTTGKWTHWTLQSHSPFLYTSRSESTLFWTNSDKDEKLFNKYKTNYIIASGC